MSVAGTWYNELGSKMELEINGASLSGTYHTAVGDAGGIYELVGSIDVDGDPSIGQAIAWVVVWNNRAKGSSHSITAWSGQYEVIDGAEEITTLWLLTAQTDPSNDWNSTHINQDIFKRNPPTEAQIIKSRKRRMPAHPV